MTTGGTGVPAANEPNEDPTGVDVAVSWRLPEGGQDLGGAGTDDTARADEAQKAQEEAMATLQDKEAREKPDLKTWRPFLTPENIAARQESIHAI
jgi:hypothetical protein